MGAERKQLIVVDTDEQSAIVRLEHAVTRLEQVVQRFVVVLERQLASNDAASAQSRRALAGLHPEMKRIQAEVQARRTKR